jgi:hypothetical protein
MRTALFAIPTVVTWSALGYKLRDLYRDPRNTVLWSFCAVVACIGLTFTLGWPPVTWRLEHATGVLAIWVVGTSVIGCAFVQLTLLLWTYPAKEARPRILARIPVYALALAVMLALDLAARPATARLDVHAYAQAPETLWGRTPLVAQSVLVFLATLAFTAVDATRHFWRYARSVDRHWLRRGLRLTGVGTLTNFWYCLAGAVYIGGLQSGITIPPAQHAMVVTAIAGVLIAAVGTTMPAWGPWLDRIRSYRRLHPLWFALSEAAPEVVLDRPPRWAVRNADFRLYRRVIEIRDSRLALRPFLDERVAASARELGRAAGLDGTALAATAEAAVLAAALAAKRRNRPAACPPGDVVPGGRDLGDEVAWLTQVAWAFTGSPVVAAVLAAT